MTASVRKTANHKFSQRLLLTYDNILDLNPQYKWTILTLAERFHNIRPLSANDKTHYPYS